MTPVSCPVRCLNATVPAEVRYPDSTVDRTNEWITPKWVLLDVILLGPRRELNTALIEVLRSVPEDGAVLPGVADDDARVPG